jgi:putative Ig domain-containing protein
MRTGGRGGAILAAVGMVLAVAVPAGAQPSAVATAKGGHAAWAPMLPPVPPNASPRFPDASISGVACPAVGSCVGVGVYDDAGDNQLPLIETLSDGTWRSTEAPPPVDATAAYLTTLACPTVGSCVAVGSYFTLNGGGGQGFLETLAGGTWSAMVAPLPSDAEPGSQDLTSVACPASGSCVAVGYDIDPSDHAQDLIEMESGTAWIPTEAPLPDNGAYAEESPGGDDFVACPIVGICVLVGNYQDASGGEQGFIESLSDGTWTPTVAPVPANALTSSITLNAVACPAAGFCVAAGQYQTPSEIPGVFETLSEGTWTATQELLPANADEAESNSVPPITSIACGSVGSCVAVGSYEARPSGDAYGVIEMLSDGTWSDIEAPLPASATPTALTAVACPVVAACVAVGPVPHTMFPSRGVIETQSARSWTPMDARLPAGAARDVTDFNALACPAVNSCVAVGSLYRGGVDRAFVEMQAAPVITSADHATFIVNQAGRFTMAATGSPAPWLSEKDTLPTGLTFVGGFGTATIAGTPTSNAGHFLVRIRASNGRQPSAVQYLTLVIRRPSS